MAKVKVNLYAHEKDNPKKTKKILTINTSDNEDIVITKSVNGGAKEEVALIPIVVDGSPPPPVDTSPTVDAGQDQTVFEGDNVKLDGTAHDNGKIISAKWRGPDNLDIAPDPEDMTNAFFVAPDLKAGMDALGLIFRLEVEDDVGNISQDSMIVTVKRREEIPPPEDHVCPEGQHWDAQLEKCVVDEPEPNVKPNIPGITVGKLLYSSNLHGQWNNGVSRVIKMQEGNIAPDGKGLYMAASGDPELHINGDGSALLVTGSGGIDNDSMKTGGNRHQRGGEPEHRFGGVGGAIARDEVDLKIESYHNVHEKGVSGKLPKPIQDEVKYRSAFVVTHKDGRIQHSIYIDYLDNMGWQLVKETEFENPKPYYMDKTLMLQHSEFWIRVNNVDHGRAYFAACNYDSVLIKEFMFKPKENALWMRDVELWEVIA